MELFRVVLVFVLLSGVLASERHCSKYDFEEKILEKLVRMEFTEKQNMAEFSRIKSDIDEKLQQMKSLNSDVENKMKELDIKVTDTVTLLTDKATSLQNDMQEKFTKLEEKITDKLQAVQVKTQTVAFKARLSSNIAVSSGMTIVYPAIMFNFGDGYDATTGEFTAPVDGTYIFDVAMHPYDNKYVNVVIVVDDDEKITNVLFYGNEGGTSYSANAVVVLKSGQKVKVKIGSNTSNGAGIDQNKRWNTFSGVLVNS